MDITTVVGTPLAMGLKVNNIADVCHAETYASPPTLAVSKLAGAPAAGGAYTTWMLQNGIGMQLWRMDGLVDVNNTISGYNVGLDFELLKRQYRSHLLSNHDYPAATPPSWRSLLRRPAVFSSVNARFPAE